MRFIRQDIILDSDKSGLGTFEIAFYGREDLDERSTHSVALTRSLARRQYHVSYNPDRFELRVGDFTFRADCLQDLPRKFPAISIVIDATTMEFPEILLLLSAYRGPARRPRCGFVYVEPKEYTRRDPDEIVARGAEFNLSSGFRAKNAIPPFAVMLSGTQKAHLVSFLGFEGGRLARVLNDDDGHFFNQVTIVFGVPPFQATWDLHAMMANFRLLEKSSTQVRFCSANTPRMAYSLLKEVHRALPGGKSDRIAVAPFGTKPMALGAALYCVEAIELRVVYDHPIRVKDRTKGIHRTLWYEVDMNT